MRPRIISFFNNIDDAKNAFGQIKKEHWNQASLAVLFTDAGLKLANGEDYEFAGESFLGEPDHRPLVWPGVQITQINGIGPVYLGSNFKTEQIIDRVMQEHPQLQQELDAHRIVTVVEVNPESLERVRAVLASNGAELDAEKSL